ncbi:hypothetical protein BDW59DRAFT_138191 [Aspergillus cavernicola]|uniref:Uncharacterized protein n=1 Tax=Aspergillus cavernicola TaxID=176166 RepID=A0ABR4J1N4_9EURO
MLLPSARISTSIVSAIFAAEQFQSIVLPAATAALSSAHAECTGARSRAAIGVLTVPSEQRSVRDRSVVVGGYAPRAGFTPRQPWNQQLPYRPGVRAYNAEEQPTAEPNAEPQRSLQTAYQTDPDPQHEFPVYYSGDTIDEPYAEGFGDEYDDEEAHFSQAFGIDAVGKATDQAYHHELQELQV